MELQNHKHFPVSCLILSVALKPIGTNWILSLFDLRAKRDSLAWGDTDAEKSKDSRQVSRLFTRGYLLHQNSFCMLTMNYCCSMKPVSVLTRRPQILGLISLPQHSQLSRPLKHSLFHLLLFCLVCGSHTGGAASENQN